MSDNNWYAFNKYDPEPNTPVLFLYEGKIYSGYYYETLEDIENNTISYLIHIPDEEDTDISKTLQKEPTHWMYVSDIKLPM